MKILTEIKTIKVQCSSVEGVYLRWKNDLGGIDQWYFQGNISQDFATEDTVSYEVFIDNLLNQTKNIEVINKEQSCVYRINTRFDKDNAEGFRQLFRSKMVEMYVVDTWYRVDVEKETFDVQKQQPYGRLTAIVKLPLIYTE